MNKQTFVTNEKQKIEEFVLQVIENVWVGRSFLLLIMAASLILFIWASGLKQHIYMILVLFLGALINFIFSLSNDKKIRDIAIFFAVMVSVCFLFIVLVTGAFFVIINRAGH